MIFGVLVDVPYVVEPRAGENVPRGEHRRHHRVVLIIVSVHAVAADHMQGRIAAFEVAPDGSDVVAIVFVVNRIGLGLAHDAGIDHVGRRHEPDLRHFLFRQRDEIAVVGVP